MTDTDTPLHAFLAQHPTLEQVLVQALSCHQAGNLYDAEYLYRVILHNDPTHPDANHNLGRLALGLGSPEGALPYLKQARDVNPSYAQFWVSYLDALIEAGQLGVAEAALLQGRLQGLTPEQARPLREKWARAYFAAHPLPPTLPVPKGAASPSPKDSQALGVLFTQGRYADMEAKARALTRRYPAHGQSWKALGMAHEGQDQLECMLPAYQKAADLLPHDAEAHNNLGNTFRAQSRFAEAEICLHRATVLAPQRPLFHYNLGLACLAQGKWLLAEHAFTNAITSQPDYVAAYSRLAATQQEQGLLHEAEQTYLQALTLAPDDPAANSNLGSVLLLQSRPAEAEIYYRKTLEQYPDRFELLSNLGDALQAQGKSAEAEAAYRQALAVNPLCYEARSNLSVLVLVQGRLPEAEVLCHDILRTHPESDAAASNLLFCHAHNAATPAATLFAEHRRFGERFEPALQASRPPHTNLRDPHRPLRIGLVSGDLRYHALAFFIQPILAELAKDPQWILHVYSTYLMEDHYTAQLRQGVAHWHAVAPLSPQALAAQIQQDEIDILIDLSGHTAYNRLLTFARKPAPIQISWMGYPGTTGLRAMDYYFADRHFLPPRFADQFVEKIVRLPASAPFVSSASVPPSTPLPALSTGHLTFGSFNRISKYSPEVIALWAQILHALPTSTMILGGLAENKQAQLADWFAAEGIDRSRLTFYARLEMPDYLALHQQVDICLDTFPYTGGTTTCHALTMGVPTLSIAGDTPASHQGIAILSQVGLAAEFIAHSKAEFVAMGVAWGGKLAELAALRATLPDRLEASPIRHPEVIAAGAGRAFRQMWTRWCAGLPPQSFEV